MSIDMLIGMSADDRDLLRRFVCDQSQDAFTALVRRHLDLVYSAALRQVRSPQLAEEVAQTVFSMLAREASKLRPDTVLQAWLYRVTRCAAIDVVRRETRRQAREQVAFQMSAMNTNSAGNWEQIEPLLEEAMHSLPEPDRTAILLRYFEQKSLREIGEALGASEDASQKRVSRALDRLRDFLSRRGVAVGTSALATLLSANAIQAAPAGLVLTIASGTFVNAVSISTSAATLTKAMIMTTVQKVIVAVVLTSAVGLALYQTRNNSRLHEEIAVLRQDQERQVALSNRVQELEREQARATAHVAASEPQKAAPQKGPNEVLRLRGEVGKLRLENASIGSTNAVSKITANPEARKMLRDQQKVGMGMIYRGFAKTGNLSSEQTEKLNDLLADHIMDNVDQVTRVLRDKPAAAEMDTLFAEQEAGFYEKVRALLGDDGLTRFQEYTKGLLATITADQFRGMLSGDEPARQAKSKQLLELLQEESQSALAQANLPADYQTIPMLNFRNIASEQEGERSVKLLEDIYTRVAARSGTFLTPEEIKKFEDFRDTGVKNNRAALMVNRTVMAPIGQ